MLLRWVVAFFLVVPSAFAYASKLPTSFDGYVTSVTWPDAFEVGARHVKFNKEAVRLLIPVEDASHSIDMLLKVGAIVHVEGSFDKQTGAFLATTIGFPRPNGEEAPTISGIGLIEERAQLSPDGPGASGTLWADGYPLQITPRTKLLSLDGQDFPADKIGPNVWAFYQAVRRPDQSIEAISIKFSPNAIDPDEAKYRDKSEPEIVLPDYSRHIPGEIKFRYQWTPNVPWELDILPDKAVQDYVARVGESLVPEYQKELPASDPTKINFRFFVIEKPSKWKETLNDASSTAGGVIYIPDNVLAVLDNESQLAALLSNCIAVTLEKQFFVHRTRAKVQNDIAWASALDFLMGPGALIAGSAGIGSHVEASRLMLKANEQASRIGLRYMLHNGYDLSEAPFAWTAAANKKIENPLQEVDVQQRVDVPQEEHVLQPLVQSVMGDLYFYYASVDLSSLKTNRDAYQAMLVKLRDDEPKLAKPKNHLAE